MSDASWKERLQDVMPADLAEEIDIFESADRAAPAGQGRREGLRRDAPAPRRLRPALRQRPAPRRHREPPLDVPRGRPTKGPETHLGRARACCASRSPTAASRRSSSRCSRSWPRSTPTASSTSRRARTSSCTSSTSTTRPDLMRRLAAVGHHDARGLRQLGAQRHRPARWPASAGPRPSTSRPTPRRSSSSCSATPTARTSAASSSPPSRAARGEACGLVEHARHRLHRPHARRSTARAQRGFEVYVGGGLGPVPHQAKLLDGVRARARSCCR